MIRFACPTCRKAFRCADDKSGRKFACPKYGQRLQIPAASNRTRDKTILGEPISVPSTSPPASDLRHHRRLCGSIRHSRSSGPLPLGASTSAPLPGRFVMLTAWWLVTT